MVDEMDLLIRQADPMQDQKAPDPGSISPDHLWQRILDRRDLQRKRRRVRKFVVVGVAAAVCATVGLIVGVLPTDGPGLRDASAAAELRTIADNAVAPITDHAVAPVPMPANGFWVQRTFAFSITSPRSTSGTSTTTDTATATVSGTLKTWASGTMSCLSATFQPVQFGSPKRETAWQDAGLASSPTTVNEPHGYCSTALGPTYYAHSHPTSVTSQGLQPIGVSTLTSDPAVLASELETGTTGIPSLDKVAQSDPQAPFKRAVLLLMAPVVGAEPGFQSVVYQALSLLPHVVALGTITTHTGAVGQGFMASSAPDAEAIVVDSHGNLLEIRNFTFLETWATLVATSFATTPGQPAIGMPPLFGQVVFTTSWVDPVGTPEVVTKSTLPPLRQAEYA
jgi:hypothetical protein